MDIKDFLELPISRGEVQDVPGKDYRTVVLEVRIPVVDPIPTTVGELVGSIARVSRGEKTV